MVTTGCSRVTGAFGPVQEEAAATPGGWRPAHPRLRPKAHPAGWAAFCIWPPPRRQPLVAAQRPGALRCLLAERGARRHAGEEPSLPVPRSLNAIHSLRLAKSPSWRQADLAALAGCTQSDLSAYETGRVIPDLRKALDIANALGRRVEDVFFELFEASCGRVGERIQRQ